MKSLQTDTEKAGFKKRLLQAAASLIEQRMAANIQAIANAQAAANAEEKSSAGDKYETARAMAHLEKDMHGRQLQANRTEMAALLNTDCSTIYKAATTGSFIQCDSYCFFIAAGLGKISFEGLVIYLLSPTAPVAKLLYQKQKGDKIIFNKSKQQIKEVF